MLGAETSRWDGAGETWGSLDGPGMCGTIWNCNEDGGGVEGPREKTLSLVMGSMDAIAQSVEEEKARRGVKGEGRER